MELNWFDEERKTTKTEKVIKYGISSVYSDITQKKKQEQRR